MQRTYFCQFLCHWEGTGVGFTGLVGPFPNAALAKAWLAELHEASRMFLPGKNGVFLSETYRASFVSSAETPASVVRGFSSHIARGLTLTDLPPLGAYARVAFDPATTRTQMCCGPFRDEDAAIAWVARFELEADKRGLVHSGTDFTFPPPTHQATTKANDLVVRWRALLALPKRKRAAAKGADRHRASAAFRLRDIPRLAKPLEELRGWSFKPDEAFVISRVNGERSIADIAKVCPFAREVALGIFTKFRDGGVFTFEKA